MRVALREAALTVLQRDGAAAFTLRNITGEAGCSTTGVYTYFGGKNGLVDAIVIDGFDSFDAAVGPGLAAGDLRGSAIAYRSWALDHPTQYMVMFGGAVPEYERSEAASTRAQESFVGLAAGVERVYPGDDSAGRAYHLFATLHGYVMLEMAGMSAATEHDPATLYDRALVDLGMLR